jgi:hypothetical protein
VLALLRGNVDGWSSARTVAELTGATLLLAAFVGIQTRVRAPMLPLQLFRRRAFTAAQVAAFAISASFFALVPAAAALGHGAASAYVRAYITRSSLAPA